MTAHRKIQFSIIAVLLVLLLLYSSDQLSGVSHDIATPGLAKSKHWVAATREKLRSDPPEVVVLGNSMVGWGFDDRLFEQISQAPTTSIWRKGAGSAWFYLALKNLILAESKPRLLIIIFRDNILTRPELRVWDRFKNDIDALAQDDTPLLDELAYLNHKNADYYFTNYLPFYAKRSLWSDRVKFMVEQYVSENIMGIEVGDLIFSLNKMFTSNGIKYREPGNQSYYQSTRLEADNLRFEQNVKTSFLPHILQLCRQLDIDLVTVRIQRLVDLEQLRDTELVDRYISDLGTYARQHSFVLIDSTGKNWLDRSHYAANDHLKESGKRRFTREIYREIQQRSLLANQP